MENNKDKVSKKTKSNEVVTDTYIPKKRKKPVKTDNTSNVTIMVNNEVVEQLEVLPKPRSRKKKQKVEPIVEVVTETTTPQ